jgi:opacity protein-like surface antigen
MEFTMTKARPGTIRFTVALAAATMLGAVSAVRADTTTDYVTPSGLYAGVGWGHFDLKLDNLNDVGAAVNNIVHSGDDAFKVQLGYRLAPFFALEGDYMNFGTPSDSFYGVGSSGNYRLHMSGFAPFAVGMLPMGPLELFAKAGWLYYDTNLRVYLNEPGQEVLQSSHSRSDFIWGGGLGVTFLRHLYLSAEYDGIRLENARDSNALWLNVAFRF